MWQRYLATESVVGLLDARNVESQQSQNTYIRLYYIRRRLEYQTICEIRGGRLFFSSPQILENRGMLPQKGYSLDVLIQQRF